MLLGEHFEIFVVFVVCTMVELLEGEQDEEGDAALNTRR
jgi:hypothetical protein